VPGGSANALTSAASAEFSFEWSGERPGRLSNSSVQTIDSGGAAGIDASTDRCLVNVRTRSFDSALAVPDPPAPPAGTFSPQARAAF
jgi:hypothetical protein